MGIKSNFLYSGFLTTSVYIFQFITYPYVARTLGVENIGICNYIQSIVQYFSLFSMLGISTLGVREISKCNGDKGKLDETFSQLFMINLLFTLSALVVYVSMIMLVKELSEYRLLLYIGASQILFNTFTVEWLFRGLEQFKYITIRSLIIRVTYCVLIFIFVRSRSDYVVYFIIYSLSVVANGIVNWNYKSRLVRLSFFPVRRGYHYMKPLLFLGTQLILTSLYTTFNIIYLGFTCNDTQVGYYTTATKIQIIILSLYSSFTIVMLPRMSVLMESDNENEVRKMIQQSLELLFAFVFPCIIFTEFYSTELVYIVAGSGYSGAVLPLKIVTPLLLVVGLEQILIVQILLPGRLDKEIFICSILGASVSMLLNFMIVTKFQSVGSSIVWLISELVVFVSACHFVNKRQFRLTFLNDIIKYSLSFIPLSIILFCLSYTNMSEWLNFVSGFILTCVYSHFLFYYFIKNSSYIRVCHMVRIRGFNK